MRNIFVVNPKGGCGKTTLATQLASYYATQNKKTLLIDRDPQKSSSDWYALRPALCKPLALLQLDADLAVNEDYTDYDVHVHDMPAGWKPTFDSPLFATTASVTHFDMLIIPVLPSPTDIKASLRFIMNLYHSGILEKKLKAGFVANRTRSHLRYHQVLVEFLQRVDIPQITSLRDSQNYIRAMEHGISIFDLPASAVKQDLEQWQPLIDWVEE